MKLQIVEYIPYRNFKEKIQITKKYERKHKVEVHNGFIYIERWEKSCSK